MAMSWRDMRIYHGELQSVICRACVDLQQVSLLCALKPEGLAKVSIVHHIGFLQLRLRDDDNLDKGAKALCSGQMRSHWHTNAALSDEHDCKWHTKATSSNADLTKTQFLT